MPRIILKEETRIVKEQPQHSIRMRRPEPEENANWQLLFFVLAGATLSGIALMLVLMFMA